MINFGLVTSALIIVVEIFVFARTWLVAPGYLSPLFASPFAIAIMIALCIWQFLGFAFVLGKSTKGAQLARFGLVVPFCVVPVFLIPMLGPALLTIAQAFGPIMSQ